MKLSELNNDFPELVILEDGEFNSTGSNDSEHNSMILSYIMDRKFIKGLSDCISCVITTNELAREIPSGISVVLAEKPKETFFKIHNTLSQVYEAKKRDTVIGKYCDISGGAIISDTNVVIGDGVVIEDGAIIKSGSTIGDNCVLRSGVIIGGEGFYFTEIKGKSTFVNHYGGVILGENVEVQYNTVIDKAIWACDNTSIGENSKLDTLIYIAHGVKIGIRCKIASGVIIGGNVIIGDNIFLGLNSTLKNHIKIGSYVTVGMGAAVLRNIPDGKTVVGNPARTLGAAGK